MCSACLPNRVALEGEVGQGIALLDVAFGNDWDKGVDLGVLDIGSTEFCVLAQVAKSRGASAQNPFSMGWLMLCSVVPTLHATYDYGFNAITDEEYVMLTEIWREKIQQRRLDRISPRVSEPEIEREPALV